MREYRFENTPVGNAGVAQNGGQFTAINYARMARLRPVTGYKGAFDWTEGEAHPKDDGIFKVDIDSGEKSLLVSFAEIAGALRDLKRDVDVPPLFINHTLWNREWQVTEPASSSFSTCDYNSRSDAQLASGRRIVRPSCVST